MDFSPPTVCRQQQAQRSSGIDIDDAGQEDKERKMEERKMWIELLSIFLSHIFLSSISYPLEPGGNDRKIRESLFHRFVPLSAGYDLSQCRSKHASLAVEGLRTPKYA